MTARMANTNMPITGRIILPRIRKSVPKKLIIVALNNDLTDDAVSKIKDYACEAQTKLTATLEEGKEIYKEKKSIITSAIEAGKEAMEREKEKAKGV